jgi:hypothetical protein
MSSSQQQRQICSSRPPARKLPDYFGPATEVELIAYHRYTAGTAYKFAGKSNGVLMPASCCGLGKGDDVKPVRFGGLGEPSQAAAEWLVSHITVA